MLHQKRIYGIVLGLTLTLVGMNLHSDTDDSGLEVKFSGLWYDGLYYETIYGDETGFQAALANGSTNGCVSSGGLYIEAIGWLQFPKNAPIERYYQGYMNVCYPDNCPNQAGNSYQDKIRADITGGKMPEGGGVYEATSLKITWYQTKIQRDQDGNCSFTGKPYNTQTFSITKVQ